MLTGIGLVSPLGIGTEDNWRALTAGQSGVGPITHFDPTEYASRIAGEVKHFDPLRFVPKKDVKKMDIFIQYAIAASQFAMDDAKLPITEENAPNVGVFLGSGIGGDHAGGRRGRNCEGAPGGAAQDRWRNRHAGALPI